MILLSMGDTLSKKIVSGRYQGNTVSIEVIEILPDRDIKDEERYTIKTKVVKGFKFIDYVAWNELMFYGNLLYHFKPDFLRYIPTKLGQMMAMIYPEMEGLLTEVVDIDNEALNYKVRVLKSREEYSNKGWRIGATISETWENPRFYLVNEDGSPIRKETKTTTNLINPCSEINNFSPLHAAHPYYTNTCPEWDEKQKRDFLRHLLGG